MLTIVVVVLAIAVVAAGWYWVGYASGRDSYSRRQRVDAERQLAEWRLQQVARSAFERMLDEARRQR